MLTYEALIEQAKLRGMPAGKIRGILREYLQVLILKEINRVDIGRRLFFTGGTYLRLAHNLKRFSEDLDFNTNSVAEKDFESLLKNIKIELGRIGANADIKFAHWGNACVAKLIFPEIEKVYSAVSKYSKKEGIIIKVETNKSTWKIVSETNVISGFGEIYPCVCTHRGMLFADKIDALLKKNRGRHLYDIIFMLSQNFSVDKQFAMTLGIDGEPLKFLLDTVKNMPKDKLLRQAEGLRPFLFDESEADLVANAQDVVPSLIEKYR